jgi:8-hydroxy-5-deazaflavin:NADPH oxidoreductase
MNGIIGSGSIGATAVRLFTEAGHKVVVSNSRQPGSLESLIKELGPRARAMTVEEAAFGEVVLVAMHLFAYETLPSDQLAGKIVVDAMNYYEGRDGQIDFDGLTSSELVARGLPGARVVEAVNTIYYETLATKGQFNAPADDRFVLFVAGGDAEVKSVVSQLIEQIGFAPVDTGSLGEGGSKQQPSSPIYNVPMNGDQARETLASME